MPITPNLNMDLPQPGLDPNTWDDKLNASLEIVDSHDHTSSKGVPVPVAGLNIDADLGLNANSLVNAKQITLNNQTVAGTQNTTLKFISGELWSFDINGVGTQITLNGTVNSTIPFSTDTPPGMIVDYAGNTAPTGYLLCDGTAVSRTTYDTLFAVISTIYGVGNGTTTFNLPDCRGRVTAGRDDMSGVAANRLTTAGSGVDGTIIGSGGGVQNVTLTTTQVPLKSHTHTASSAAAGGHSHTLPFGFDFSGALPYANTTPSAAAAPSTSTIADHTHTITVGATADLSASQHNNTQPTIVFNKIIKT